MFLRCPACNGVWTIWLKPTQLYCQTCGKTTKIPKPSPKPKPAKET